MQYNRHEPVTRTRTKIVCLPLWPSQYYTNLFERTAKNAPDLDIVMVVPNESKPYWKRWPFRVRGLQDRLRFRIVYTPYLIVNRLAGKKVFEVPALLYYKGLEALLDEERPALVVANLEYAPTTWQAARWCRRNGVPFIVQTEIQRLPNEWLTRVATRVFLLLKRRVFTGAAHITAWTRMGQQYVRQTLSIPAAKISVLPLPVDTKLFKPPLRKTLSRTLRLLMIARFVPYKRHEDMLEALARLRASGVPVTLSLLGKGPNKDAVRNTIRERGLDDVVTVLPDTPHAKMPQLYARHDVLVLPSRNEAIGVVAAEALACGVPVIVSDTTGATTYVRNGKDGFVFTTGDVDGLTAAIKRLTDARTRERMGRYGRARMEQDFDPTVVAQDFEAIIRKSL